MQYDTKRNVGYTKRVAMQWTPYNGLTQIVVSANDTYTVLTSSYDDTLGVFSWLITPSTVPWGVMVYSGTVINKSAIEALITAFETYSPPPEPLPPENSDVV